jgi:hypothetical protein
MKIDTRNSTGFAFLFGICLTALIFHLSGRPEAMDPASTATASYLSGDWFIGLERDQYLVTSSESGEQVNPWDFERRGDETESKIFYVTRAPTGGGPFLK